MKNLKYLESPIKSILFVLVFYLFSFSAEIQASSNLPRIEAPGAELRKSPLFESETLKLAPVWGEFLPAGNRFQIERSYGRWLFGGPAPLAGMNTKDQAPNGWVYNRMLVAPGDAPSLSGAVIARWQTAEIHAQKAQTALGLTNSISALLTLRFLGSLVLSENTLEALEKLDEKDSTALNWESLFEAFTIPSANAARKNAKALGFAGANLDFLQAESRKLEAKRNREREQALAKILKPPVVPPAEAVDKNFFFGRYLAYRNFELPSLSHEEVDGHLYLRAITTRTLRGCANETKNFFMERFWNAVRVRTMIGRPAGENLWFQFALPGNLFLHSDQVLRLATDEAELAFALIRPLVMTAKVGEIDWAFSEKWLESLPKQAGDAITRLRNQHSSRFNPNLDVAADLAIDLAAIQCLAAAGYRASAGLSYLAKLRTARESDWASWFMSTNVGLDYRLERLEKDLQLRIKEGTIRNGMVTNKRRLLAAQKLWNL